MVSRNRQIQFVSRHEQVVDEQRDSLHHVRHFPHVPGPPIGDEGCPRILCERFRRQPILGTGARQEVFGEREDVLSPLSKRRESKRHHRKPVVELLAKPSPARPQILARGGDDPDVHRLGAGTAQPSDRPVLEDREQLGLEALGQQADLVEEECPSVGGLEQARLGMAGVGEGSLLEAEQFRFEQSLGNRGAVHSDERPGRPGPRVVDGPGEQALARPRLTDDQDGGKPACLRLAAEKLLDLSPHGYQSRALTY